MTAQISGLLSKPLICKEGKNRIFCLPSSKKSTDGLFAISSGLTAGPEAAVKWRQQLTLDLPPARRGAIWVHACSVGEVNSVVPLIDAFLADGEDIHLTVVTRTGFANAHRRLASAVEQGSVTVSYLPWDLPGFSGRMIRRLRPRALLLTETEFWPGMLAACRRASVVVIGINTRISDRSFPRYRASRWLWRRWLAPVRLFLAQSETDADRLRALGIDPTRVVVSGNLKTAVPAPEVDSRALRSRVDPSEQRPILLVASSHACEEEALLRHLPTWLQHRDDLIVLIVPRHPERFDVAVEVCRDFGFSAVRWSSEVPLRADQSVMVVDAMGVLSGLFTVADLVVMGGSMVDHGGHNPLEAAVCGRGVVTGPHVQNFRTLMDEMAKAGAAIVAENDEAVAATVSGMLGDPSSLRRLHEHAAAWMARHGDVLQTVHDLCVRYIPPRCQ